MGAKILDRWLSDIDGSWLVVFAFHSNRISLRNLSPSPVFRKLSSWFCARLAGFCFGARACSSGSSLACSRFAVGATHHDRSSGGRIRPPSKLVRRQSNGPAKNRCVVVGLLDCKTTLHKYIVQAHMVCILILLVVVDVV